jgi:hypothetical protein
LADLAYELGADSGLFRPMQRNYTLAEALGLKKEDKVISFVGEMR